MNRVFKGLGITLAILTAILAAIYILLGFYYMDGFPCFTWINGVYCTGKTVSEVNEELCSKYPYSGINVVDANGAELFVSSYDVRLKIDFTDSLNNYLEDKNPFAWGLYFFDGLVANFAPTVSLDEVRLSDKISNWEIFMPGEDLNVYIEKTASKGYILKNEMSSVPERENIIKAVSESMHGLKNEVRLASYPECYHSIKLDPKQQETVDLFEKIDALENCGIEYRLGGEELPVSRGVVSEWLVTEEELDEAQAEKQSRKAPGQGLFIVGGEEKTFPEGAVINNGFAVDDSGNLIVSESKMYGFLYEIAREHGSSWTMERYRQGEGNEVIINDSDKGDGFIYDIDAEFEALKTAYITGSYKDTAVRDIQLSDDAVVYDANEKLGRTYIEINMGEQMLYYYVDGKLDVDMPVVTGNVNRGRGTPTGIFSVYNKRYHTNLVGIDYVSYVNYWLGVYKGVGIHDATWRSRFGEDIYKRDGSHGCINCPLDLVSGLWETVDVGTPVVMYY